MERAPDLLDQSMHPGLKDGQVSHLLWDVPLLRQANVHKFMAEVILLYNVKDLVRS